MKLEIKKRIREVFSADVRSLALFRIGLGLLLLFDLAIRSEALVAHYTDVGVLPRAELINFFSNPNWISLHLISGEPIAQAVLFLIAAFFAFSLLIGYKTKISTIVSWFLLISLHSRNPMILQGGDIVFRMILFWAMFLPLGNAYSVDALNSKQKKEKIFSFGVVGIYIQVASIYFFSALLKTGDEWFPDGTAIYYALSIDQFATPIGSWLLHTSPAFLTFLTYFVFFFELIAPLLLFMPFFFGAVRTVVVFGFLFLNLSMGSSLYLGPFPWINAVSFLVFFPSWFWDKINIKSAWKKLNSLFLIIAKKLKIKKEINAKKSSRILNLITNILALFFIVYILAWNIQSVGYNSVPDKAEIVASIFRVDQLWNMFSPYPLKDDGWYVIAAELGSGKKIDLIRDGKTISWEKPENVAKLYKHERWRKYMMNLWNRENSAHRKYYARYKCYEWNKDNDDKIKKIEIYFMKEETLPDYQKPEIEKILLYAQECD